MARLPDFGLTERQALVGAEMFQFSVPPVPTFLTVNCNSVYSVPKFRVEGVTLILALTSCELTVMLTGYESLPMFTTSWVLTSDAMAFLLIFTMTACVLLALICAELGETVR